MKRQCFGLLLLFAVLAAQAGADEILLQAVAEELEPHSAISGRFQQQKFLPFMQAPLASSGCFQIDSQGELFWLVDTPLRSLLQVQGGQVLLDGAVVQDHGVGQLLSGLLSSILRAEPEGLSERFDVSGEVTPGYWRLQLLPRSKRLAVALKSMQVSGDVFLRQIELSEGGEGRTKIVFQDIAPAHAENAVACE